ncbi:MAG: hypothetical protein Q9217_002265 [Psora testacea]
MADPLSASGLALGVVSAVIQTYGAVMQAYDVYLGVKDFSNEYQDIRMGLLIEKARLELWGRLVLFDHPPDQKNINKGDLAFWSLFELIFNSIVSSLQDSNRTMERFGQQTNLPTQEGLLDYEWIENLSLSAKQKPKFNLDGIHRKIKFILRDRTRMQGLIRQLCYWNDSLEKMRSQLEQESLRRQLRTQFSTRDSTELPQIVAAAALLDHRDIQKMASAKIVVEQGRRLEELGVPQLAVKSTQSLPMTLNSTETPETPDFQLDMRELEWKHNPFATEQVRATAIYKGEDVIVDWRSCQDDTWRKNNPTAFERRTQNLTSILNSDLRPLNLSILHCVGYLNQSKNFTGYAFRVPDHARRGQKHVTLHDLLSRVRNSRDMPDLGDRFGLAKALVSTVFEIHNIGWMHKNVQPRNVVFWPKEGAEDEADITKPYLMGFDVSRPNQPDEFSERPRSRPDDDHYRHPSYKGPEARSFQPSFDFYSLGVVLFEIGIWRNLAASVSSHGSRPTLPSYRSDPLLIEKMMEKGPQLELRKYTGGRYRDVVTACLDKGFDFFWEDPPAYDRQTQLQRYLRQVQNKIVDPLAVCNA